MKDRPDPRARALIQAVDEVLHYVWDPIGASTAPRARDEYHAYVPQVFGMLRQDRSARDIADYLTSVTTRNMGLIARTARDLTVAELLIEWRDVIASRHA